MIVVRVELHSAITGIVTEIARMHVCNQGGTKTLGDYSVDVFKGRSKKSLDAGKIQRTSGFGKYPRQKLHVWNLVLCALVAAGYKGYS